MELIGEDILKIVLAMLIGGVIGAEREFRNKAAGFRTILLICVGATLFTMLSSRLAEGSDADSTRIAAQIVSGIGFLGAGVILRQQGHVVGLTTAAVIWLAAALGMAVGAEMYALSVVVTVLTMIILWIFPHFEAWIDQLQENRSYVVTLAINRDKFDMLDTIFRSSSLVIKGHALHKSGENMICTWHTYGAPTTHNDIMNTLFNDPDVIQFEF